MIIGILLGITVLLLIIFGFIIRNLLKQVEGYEDLLQQTIFDIKVNIGNALLRMKEADIRGAFEADDEVGQSFKDIKNVLNELNEKF